LDGSSGGVRDGSDDTSVKTKAVVETGVEAETSVDTVEAETSVELGPNLEDTPKDASSFHHV